LGLKIKEIFEPQPSRKAAKVPFLINAGEELKLRDKNMDLC
jgi:hypothetical protein